MRLTVLDRINLSRLWLQTAFGEYHRWRKQSLGSEDIRVFYGFDHIPAADEQAFGGIVKLQDLQRICPNRPQGANILYLVSSALPDFAVRMAGLARKAGVKIVLNQNGVAYPGWFGNGWEQQNRPIGRLLHMADHVFYQSRFCRQSADRFAGRRHQAAEILYNPVDTTIFKPDGQAGGRKNGLHLLLAGSHQKYYRVKVAVEALRFVLRKVPEARLCIAGRCCWEKDASRALSQVRQLAVALGVDRQIDYVGPYTQAQAPALFNQAHILLHTKYNDPCPRLVVEAMACGLPVVYSDTGGVPELVGKDAGIGVRGPVDWHNDHPPDPEEIAAAVMEIVTHGERYAAAPRKRAVEKFDVRPWLDRHKALFADLANG